MKKKQSKNQESITTIRMCFCFYCDGHQKIPECISKFFWGAADCQCPKFSFIFNLKKDKNQKLSLKTIIAATTTIKCVRV